MELTGLADCLGAGVMGEGRAQSDVCISDLGGEGKGSICKIWNTGRGSGWGYARLRVMCSEYLEYADLGIFCS